MAEEFKQGQIVSYKRNGNYGSYDAEVISVGEKRVRILVKAWCGVPVSKEYYANVSIKRIRK